MATLEKRVRGAAKRFVRNTVADLAAKNVVVTSALKNSIQAEVNKRGEAAFDINVKFLEYGDIIKSWSYTKIGGKIATDRQAYRVIRKRYRSLMRTLVNIAVDHNLKQVDRLFLNDYEV